MATGGTFAYEKPWMVDPNMHPGINIAVLQCLRNAGPDGCTLDELMVMLRVDGGHPDQRGMFKRMLDLACGQSVQYLRRLPGDPPKYCLGAEKTLRILLSPSGSNPFRLSTAEMESICAAAISDPG